MHNLINRSPGATNLKTISGDNNYGKFKQFIEANDNTFTITKKYTDGTVNRIVYIGKFEYRDRRNLLIDESSTIKYYLQATWEPSVEIRTYDAPYNYLGNGEESGGKLISVQEKPSESIMAWEYHSNHPFSDGDHDDYWEHGRFNLGYSSISNSFNPDSSNSTAIGELRPGGGNIYQTAPAPADKRPSKLGIQNLSQLIPSEWWLDPFSPTGKNSNNMTTEAHNGNSQTITKPARFNNKSADKITNFKPSTNTLEIDTNSFGIHGSATFAPGKNTKEIKKILAKQAFNFLYDQKKGGLYFNENGSSKGFGDGGIIAVLKGAPDLTINNLSFT